MANPIKASDLYHDDGALERAIKQLQELAKQHEAVLAGVKKEAISLTVQTKKLNATTANQRDEIASSARQAEKLQKAWDKYGQSLEETEREIVAVKEAQKKLNQVNRLEAKLNIAKESSYNALSAKYSLLKLRINQMTKAERESTAEGRKMVKQSKEIFDEMKRLQEATGKTALNVGNYKESIKEALMETNLFPGALGQVAHQVSAVSKALKASIVNIGGTNKALRLFKIALASTGIGAIVLVLGSLVAFLTKTQKGIDLVNRVMAGFKAVADIFIDRLSAIGEKLTTDFIGTVKEAGNSVGDFFKAILNKDYASFISQTAGAATAIKELKDEIVEESQAAMNLAKALQGVRDKTQALEVRTARARAEIKRLNLIAEDTTKTFAERADAAERAGSIERSLMAERQSLLQTELRLLEQQKGLSNSLFEDEQQLADKRKEIAQVQTESLELQTTINNKLNIINEQARKAAQALTAELAEAAAVLGGPAEQARLEYDKALLKIDELKESARQLNQEFDFSSMEDLAAAKYERSIDAIRLSTKKLADDGLKPLAAAGKVAADQLEEIKAIVAEQGLAKGFTISKEGAEALNNAFSTAKQGVSDYLAEVVNLANFQQQRATQAVQEAQTELQTQLQLSQAGLANRVETAQEGLRVAKAAQDEATRQQQKAQRAQLVAQSIQQASNLITAVTKLFAELPFFLALPASGALFTTFAAAKVKAFQATKLFKEGGFETLDYGGSHQSGRDIPLGTTKDGRQRRAERGEALAIFSRKATGRYGSMLPELVNAINRGEFERKYSALTNATDTLPGFNSIVNVNTTGVESRLDALRREQQRQVWTDGKGRRVERIGNRKTIYV